jgi:hypothetical protein
MQRRLLRAMLLGLVLLSLVGSTAAAAAAGDAIETYLSQPHVDGCGGG